MSEKTQKYLPNAGLMLGERRNGVPSLAQLWDNVLCGHLTLRALSEEF